MRERSWYGMSRSTCGWCSSKWGPTRRRSIVRCLYQCTLRGLYVCMYVGMYVSKQKQVKMIINTKPSIVIDDDITSHSLSSVSIACSDECIRTNSSPTRFLVLRMLLRSRDEIMKRSWVKTYITKKTTHTTLTSMHPDGSLKNGAGALRNALVVYPLNEINFYQCLSVEKKTGRWTCNGYIR